MDFLTILREKLQVLINERQAAKADLDAILAAPTAEGRDLNADEATRFAAAKALVQRYADPADEKSIGALEARIAELAAIEAERQEVVAVPPPSVTVRSEERTYDRASERRGVSFMRDIIDARSGNTDAAERIARHGAEMRIDHPGIEARAVGTTAFGALVVPTHLVSEYGPDPKASRPLANICTSHALPTQGMTVEIARITTPTGAAVQATQNAAVQETNMDETTLSVAVQTVAAQQTISRQAIDRGSGIEEIALADMLGEINTVLDSTLLNQAANGLANLAGVNSIAYTDASPTAAEAWPKLFDGVSQAQAGGLNVASSSAVVLHPRRFWWFASQVGTNFPFVTFPAVGPQAGGAVETTGYGDGMSGRLGPLPAYVDANVATNTGAGTNEDTLFVVSTSEAHLWEDEVVIIRADQTAAASLGVLFVASKYFAFTFGRQPASHSKVTGTGFVTPTF